MTNMVVKTAKYIVLAVFIFIVYSCECTDTQ